MEQPKKRLNFTLLIASLGLILSVVIAIGLGYRFWQSYRVLPQAKNFFVSLHKQTQQNKNSLSGLQNNVADLQTQLQQQQVIVVQLQRLKEGDQHPWIFSEVNYLIQLAYYNLTFTRDVPAATALLQLADQRLGILNDPTLSNIRQLLAKHIVTLQAIPPLDLAGLLARLNALQEQVLQLPLRKPLPTPEKSAAKPATAETLPAWRRALQASLDTLQKLVVIRRSDQPIVPLLPQEQQAYLQHNLQLLLQQAQSATLRGQADVYQMSLQQAKIWIQHYFASDTPATQAILRTLNELQKINVRPALPDLTNLIQTVQRAATTMHHQGDRQ